MSGASPFDKVVLTVIGANTVVLVWGLVCDEHQEHVVDHLHTAFLVFFVVELAVRYQSAGSPRRFASDAWNVFDAIVTGLALLPVLGVGVTLLRVARAARVLHSLRHASHLRTAAFLRFARNTQRDKQGETA